MLLHRSSYSQIICCKADEWFRLGSVSNESTHDGDSAGENFGWTLGVLIRNYQNATAEVTAEFPHGPRGYQVMVAVIDGSLPNQLALATHLGIDRTVMTYLIDDFVKAGLVERQLNPADRRARIVVATPKGRSELADLERRVREVESRVLGALDQQEQDVFRGLLRRVACGSPEPDHSDLGACAAVEQMLGTGAPS